MTLLSQMLASLRTRPLDGMDVSARGRERDRRVVLSALASAGAKAASIAAMLITIPVTLDYLGAERYGLWMTVTSFLIALSFADFGVGFGLMNALSEALGKSDRALARQYVSTGIVVLTGIAVALSLIFVLAYPFVTWPALFNVKTPEAVREAGPTAAVLFGITAANIPLAIVQRVQAAQQEAYKTSLWFGSASLLSVAAVLIAVDLGASLPVLVACVMGVPAAAMAANGVVETWKQPWMRLAWSACSRPAARRLIGSGMLFVLLQLMGTAVVASDNIVATHVLGPEAVATYSVPARLFGMAPLLLGFFFGPLWPAYGEAMARGDSAWIRRTLMRSLLLALVVSLPVAIAGVTLGKPILHLWVGSAIDPSTLLMAGLAVWCVLGSLGGVPAMFLNGLNVLRFQVICATLMALSAVPLKIWLTGRIGLPGIVWSMIGPQIVFLTLPTGLLALRLVGKLPSRP